MVRIPKAQSIPSRQRRSKPYHKKRITAAFLTLVQTLGEAADDGAISRETTRYCIRTMRQWFMDMGVL